MTRPNSKVPCTAPTLQQLNDVLWSEIRKWIETSNAKAYFEWTKTKIVVAGNHGRWFATARTANKPENMAGFHDDHLLFIVDEASGVMDGIYETIEGALTTTDTRILMCGNPTRNSGVFHDSFFRDRDRYYTMKVSCLDSPNVTPEYAEGLKKKYKEDSDVYRVRVLGEFPKAEADSLIPLEWCERAIIKELELSNVAEDTLYVGADIARFGNDETVIVGRIGGKMLGMYVYSKQDTMVTSGKILAHVKTWLKQHPCAEVEVRVDDTGVGGGVTDRLREVSEEEGLGYRIVAVNNGAKANDSETYENVASENWHYLRDLLEANDVQLINDDDLVGQLSSRKFRMSSKGKIALERKDDMKRRGLNSPDRADAIVLAFMETPPVNPFFLLLEEQYHAHLHQDDHLKVPETRTSPESRD